MRQHANAALVSEDAGAFLWHCRCCLGQYGERALVEQYLAFAETIAQQQIPMYVKNWIERLDAILQLNGRELLTHAGKISHQMALEKSEEFNQQQKATEKEASFKALEGAIQKPKSKGQ